MPVESFISPSKQDNQTSISQMERLTNQSQKYSFQNWEDYKFGKPSINEEKKLIKTVSFKNHSNKANEVIQEKPKHHESASVSPFFDLEKSVHLYRKLVDLYGEKKGTELARKVFIKDIDSQLWELRETATSFQYRMYLINDRLVHESDLHNNTPLLDGVTDKIRRGKEREQMILLEQLVKDLPIGATILIPSPKMYSRDETEEECPYPDSILTRITKIDENTYQGLQTMSKLEAHDMAALINKLAGKQVVDPKAHIDKILMSLTTVNKSLSDLEIIHATEQITGKKILTKSSEEYQQEEKRFAEFSQNGGEQLLSWIKQEIGGKQLVEKYTKMMATFLKGVQSSKVHHDDNGGVVFDTSCGSFGSSGVMRVGIRNSEFSSGTENMWCTNKSCQKENEKACLRKDKTCHFCGSKLTDKKP